MRRRPVAITVLLPAIGLALLLTGCPKRPVTITAQAPSPVAVAPSPAPVPAPTPAPVAPPVAVAPSPPTPAPAPAPVAPPTPPKDFAANDALKTIHFDFDKSDIRAQDARILDANAAWLKEHPNQIVLIEGHCDERGTNEYNMALGDRRAKATQEYLISRGLDVKRFTTISYGEERPLCTQKGERCWSQNRRAQFLAKEQ
jgi:peptidoglycan-associated lipoprotein